MQFLTLFFREAADNNIIRFPHKFFDCIVRYILPEIDTNPVFLIHMPVGVYADIHTLQFSRFIERTFDAAEVEYFDIHTAEPFVEHIKTQHITAIFVRYIRKWYLCDNFVLHIINLDNKYHWTRVLEK